MEPHNHMSQDATTEEIRCFDCNRLLAKGLRDNGIFEIKCVRCGSFNTLSNGLTDQIIITDPKGVILYVNERITEMTGYSAKEIIGKKPSVWGGQMPRSFYDKMWKTLNDEKKSFETEVTNRRKDGTTYQAHLLISPVMGLNGNIEMFVGVETFIK